MIRNGMPRKLAAQAARAELLELWQVYPQPVRRLLKALVQRYGLEAAQLATQAVEHASRQQDLPAGIHVPERKEERDDAPPA